MLEEFKKFALRGNAVDLAIGVIIGAAFGAIVNSLVGDILSPIIGASFCARRMIAPCSRRGKRVMCATGMEPETALTRDAKLRQASQVWWIANEG